jgi:hypothetical protein
VVQNGGLTTEPELPQVDMLKHLERAHAEQMGGLLHRGIEIVGPVPDVVQAAPRGCGHAPPPQDWISGSSSAANRRMLASTCRGSMPGWWNWIDISSIGRSW